MVVWPENPFPLKVKEKGENDDPRGDWAFLLSLTQTTIRTHGRWATSFFHLSFTIGKHLTYNWIGPTAN